MCRSALGAFLLFMMVKKLVLIAVVEDAPVTII